MEEMEDKNPNQEVYEMVCKKFKKPPRKGSVRYTTKTVEGGFQSFIEIPAILGANFEGTVEQTVKKS